MTGDVARLVLIAVFFCAGVFAQGHWQLAWSDEFSGAAGTLPDPSKWTYDLGAGGWGNGELETYTNSTRNVYQDGQGNLVVHVEKDGSGYTSARLKTKGLFSFTYGKVEARIQIPRGQGIWPAFWMLGANIDQVNWPQSGEIDIMENIGKEGPSLTAVHLTKSCRIRSCERPKALPRDSGNPQFGFVNPTPSGKIDPTLLPVRLVMG